MAGVANEAYNYNKDSNEEIEEEEEEQIYDSIDENSSDSFSLSNEKELKDELEAIDNAIDLKIQSIKKSNNSNLSNGNGEGRNDAFKTENGDKTAPEKLPIKKRRSTASSSKTHSYHEVTINFGKPVIQKTVETSMLTQKSKNNNQDIFDSVCFTSPIQDIEKVIVRHSSTDRGSPSLSDSNETSNSFYYEKPNLDVSEKSGEPNSNRPPPVPTPRTSLPKLRGSTKYHNIDIQEVNKPRASKDSEPEEICDNNGRYEDIDSIDCDSDNIEIVNNYETEHTYNSENSTCKTVIIHPEYSDVRDFALSLVDK